jgi:hypothetical protein
MPKNPLDLPAFDQAFSTPGCEKLFGPCSAFARRHSSEILAAAIRLSVTWPGT